MFYKRIAVAIAIVVFFFILADMNGLFASTAPVKQVPASGHVTDLVPTEPIIIETFEGESLPLQGSPNTVQTTINGNQLQGN
jgi:hypothetical protein